MTLGNGNAPSYTGPMPHTRLPLPALSCRWLHAGPLAALLALAGCGGGSGPVPMASAPEPAPVNAPGPRFPQSLAGLEPGGAATLARRLATVDGGYAVNPQDRDTARLFYGTVFASSNGVASGWSGSIAGCNAGDTSADYKAATLRRVNWFRAMAGVPAAVQLDATYNAKAQQAAMLMSANGQLSHFPPNNWTCYNATAAEAAGKSNLSLGNAGPDAVANGYMWDPGASNNVVGHRRWVLYPQTRLMGTGDVPDNGNFNAANALWVQDPNIFSTRPAVRDDFVAWPAKGYAPYTVVYPRWSFSYPDADFSKATVSMTENGLPMATRLEPVTNGYGENTLAWLPGSYTDGMTWARPANDTVYQVTVANVLVNGQSRSFTYGVTVFDPDLAGASAPLALSGAASASTGQASGYSFNAQGGATGYQWRALSTTPYTLDDGAEGGNGNFTTSTSAGYSIITSDAAASGANAFHLAHTQFADQVLQLKTPLVGTPGANLSFSSRLGLSSPAQVAKVEISLDEGASWSALYSQAGQQSGSTSSFGESSFSTKQVSLAAYADKTFLLRFRYQIGNGSFYPQASAGIGWYIDNIHLAGVEALGSSGTPASTNGTAFSFTPTQAGTALLQVRAGMYGFYADWSTAKRVTVTAGTAVSPRDCLFNWAEKTYPALFSPAASSLTVAPYYVRFYAASNSYLGFSSSNNHLYWLNAQGLLDLGDQATWLSLAGCP